MLHLCIDDGWMYGSSISAYASYVYSRFYLLGVSSVIKAMTFER